MCRPLHMGFDLLSCYFARMSIILINRVCFVGLIPISGVFDVRPLVHTSVNDPLKMSM